MPRSPPVHRVEGGAFCSRMWRLQAAILALWSLWGITISCVDRNYSDLYECNIIIV